MLSVAPDWIVRAMVRSADSQIYRDLMRFKPDDLSANGWAVKAGVSRTVWADMRRHGNPSRRTLEKRLSAAGSTLAEFEALRIGAPPAGTGKTSDATVGEARNWRWRPAPLPPLPLLETSMAGEWGETGSGIELVAIDGAEVLDHLPRPESLASDRDAYALTIVGDSMWPRFRPGRRIAVSPRSPVAIGDDVVVRVGKGRALVKELVKRTGAWLELRQFNPDLTFRMDAADVEAIHTVAGELF